MKILRTEGGGSFTENERLEKLKTILQKIDFWENEILLLHDHKGLLTVTWLVAPHEDEKQLLKYLWVNFREYEIEHKYILNNYPL